jgi:uncharacterized repeat protein (TIGR03803 family)
VPGPSGTIYGSDPSGGAAKFGGSVFAFVPGSGIPTVTLHAFKQLADGGSPTLGYVDAAGNVYGTNSSGSNRTACSGGCGNIFVLSPPVAGKATWPETVLHSFVGTDGYAPNPGLTADGNGSLFGTTSIGGASGAYSCGTIYRLMPAILGQPKTTFKTLYKFPADLSLGCHPTGPLLIDKNGSLWGTTLDGGPATATCGCSHGSGTVFRLDAPASGKTAWTLTVVHSFTLDEFLSSGQIPNGFLAMDASGAIYQPVDEIG